jgi:hypothetical protein
MWGYICAGADYGVCSTAHRKRDSHGGGSNAHSEAPRSRKIIGEILKCPCRSIVKSYNVYHIHLYGWSVYERIQVEIFIMMGLSFLESNLERLDRNTGGCREFYIYIPLDSDYNRLDNYVSGFFLALCSRE